MESFPREQLHPADGWRISREARTFLSGSYTLVHTVLGEGKREPTRHRRRCAGRGRESADSPGQQPPPPPAWSAAKPHKNATRSHDLRRTCNSLPSPGRPCAILNWRSYKNRHELRISRSRPAPLLTAPALLGKEKPQPGPAFLFTSSSGIPRPWSPPWRWGHGARFLPLRQHPRQLPNPAQLRLPLLQDDVSAGQSGRTGLARPPWLLAPAQLPPPSWLRLRRGSLRSRSQGTSGGRGIGGEEEKKKTYTKKPTTKPTKTPAAISRNNRQNPSEQPQPSALRRERERGRETRDTRTEELDRKKYP